MPSPHVVVLSTFEQSARGVQTSLRSMCSKLPGLWACWLIYGTHWTRLNIGSSVPYMC